MTDDNSIIEGTVKFRDGKKWKSRWCVMRKLSPVADCVHLQLYRDSKARWSGVASKASLSLQHYLGCEAGFTLDKHSNTLALVCRDLVAILAFETRERLIQWQVKVSAHLGEPHHYLVLVGGLGRLAAGPARLHLHERRLALTAGVPPRLLGVWELPHLRRYGVVEGRFCFEGGSHCGKGEGLHVLITDQAHDIARDFDLASQGRLSPKRRLKNSKRNEHAVSPDSRKAYHPNTRLSELNTIDQSLPPLDFRHYDEACGGEETGAISPYWPSQERNQFHDMGLGDTLSVHEGDTGDATAWGSGVGNLTLERCMSCISKLGAMSRSSTAALTPGAKHFNPAWTMEPVQETNHDSVVRCGASTITTDKTEVCHCPEWPERLPERPPKPTKLDLQLNNRPLTCSCAHTAPANDKNSRVGPYENYDVPKLPSAEVEGEYYDTPKRLKECLSNELFTITKCSTPSSVIIKKPCGCLLKFGKKKSEPKIIDSEENFQPSNCPCQRVTDWANNWMKLPYCRKNTFSSDNLRPNKENLTPDSNDRSALYATIDLSRKTRRKSRCAQHYSENDCDTIKNRNFRTIEIQDNALANYENLSFAMSLEHYENAKELLRKTEVTQTEINESRDNLPAFFTAVNGKNVCMKCGHPQKRVNENQESSTIGANDDYLMMEPNTMDSTRLEKSKPLPSGYTPMSPVSGFAYHTIKLPVKSPINRLLEEKSASNPSLSSPDDSRRIEPYKEEEEICEPGSSTKIIERIEYRKRSNSADSSRFLEEVKEFEGSIDSRGSNSSLETLRNIALNTPTPCTCVNDNKHSDADSSEASKCGRGKGTPPARRSSSVPGKAGGNRDSSSSNDSGVSTCSLRRAGELTEFELPLTTSATRRHYRSARRAAACIHTSLPRRSKSIDPLRDIATLQRVRIPAKSSSAEAEVPILTVKPLRSILDTHSTSSGTSDMSDYIETLSICSSHSSTDTPVTMRVLRPTTSTLRPRSGKEYHSQAARLAAAHPHPPPHLYSHRL